MCDTVAIVEPGRVVFAKNSDRDPNEAQFPDWYPRCTYPADSVVRCTWLEIPQVRETRAVLLSRPFWMWGAEIGANEDGVVIGNEAVFTNQPYAPTGLTGMDLLRLALERARNARDACRVITSLLETHGQGGGCGYENRRFTYHNSFIVVDRGGGYVLETAGRHWACEPIQGVAAISNGLMLPGFFFFYRDRFKTAVTGCNARRVRSIMYGCSSSSVENMFALLRDHGADRRYPRYRLGNGGMSAPCMHAGGILAASQTTASWVSELKPEGDLHWVTATAAPCTSLFKPVHVLRPADFGPLPEATGDKGFWWMHERFHRLVMKDPEAAFPVFEEERNAVEQEWLRRPPHTRTAVRKHLELLQAWMETPSLQTLNDKRPRFVRSYWKKQNKRCGLQGTATC